MKSGTKKKKKSYSSKASAQQFTVKYQLWLSQSIKQIPKYQPHAGLQRGLSL